MPPASEGSCMIPKSLHEPPALHEAPVGRFCARQAPCALVPSPAQFSVINKRRAVACAARAGLGTYRLCWSQQLSANGTRNPNHRRCLRRRLEPLLSSLRCSNRQQHGTTMTKEEERRHNQKQNGMIHRGLQTHILPLFLNHSQNSSIRYGYASSSYPDRSAATCTAKEHTEENQCANKYTRLLSTSVDASQRALLHA